MTSPAITWSLVSALAPEIEGAGLNATQQGLIVEAANGEVNADAWPNKALAQLAAINLAAHRATMLIRKGKAPLQSVTVGPVTKVFSVVAKGANPDPLDETVYGQEFKRMCRIHVAHGATT